MKLTKAQREFFENMDLDGALEAGEDKVRFNFSHNGRIITVEAHETCCANVIVEYKDKAGSMFATDKSLSLFNIPGTMNVPATLVLRMVYEAAAKKNDSMLKRAWLDTPYVEQWDVSAQGACIEFTFKSGKDQYLIEASEDPNNAGVTVAELFMDGSLIHTFNIQQRYLNRQTAQNMFDLADAITEEWRDTVLAEYNEEKSK